MNESVTHTRSVRAPLLSIAISGG